ncbi:MAG: DUF6883 domain-containing protein [Candidatus Rokuibacteriota bacterium]
MRLPGGERAIIDPEKLRDYVLSRAHPVGRFKATFFASLGYGIDNWQDLDRALRAAAGQAEAELGERTPYGQKYRIRSMLGGPAGRSADIVSVWIILHDETTPRLVTVMPRG